MHVAGVVAFKAEAVFEYLERALVGGAASHGASVTRRESHEEGAKSLVGVGGALTDRCGQGLRPESVAARHVCEATRTIADACALQSIRWPHAS